ncbi:Protein of unknown function, partial [Gryllus bimaculatus]
EEASAARRKRRTASAATGCGCSCVYCGKRVTRNSVSVSITRFRARRAQLRIARAQALAMQAHALTTCGGTHGEGCPSCEAAALLHMHQQDEGGADAAALCGCALCCEEPAPAHDHSGDHSPAPSTLTSPSECKQPHVGALEGGVSASTALQLLQCRLQPGMKPHPPRDGLGASACFPRPRKTIQFPSPPCGHGIPLAHTCVTAPSYTPALTTHAEDSEEGHDDICTRSPQEDDSQPTSCRRPARTSLLADCCNYSKEFRNEPFIELAGHPNRELILNAV